jgi:hypothetical protein
MDDRQSGIKEGAGLEDSRVNQEFIDFLQKWSSPVIMVLAVAALVWAGLQYLERQRVAKIDQAFSELDAAMQGGNPSPSSLKTIAAEYEGIKSVSQLALLQTSDLYLAAFVSGIEPGAQRDPQTGEPTDESDVLDDAKKQTYLEQAGQIAQQVLDQTTGVEGKELLAMQAMSRLASVAEGKRNFDGAVSMYKQLETLANQAQYPSIAVFAANRIENVDSLKAIAPLPSKDELAELPGAISQDMIDQLMKSVSDVQPDPSVVPEPESTPEPADEPAAEETDLP